MFWTKLYQNADTKPELNRLDSYHSDVRRRMIDEYRKVFLSREPSARLWSAFNDKIVVPTKECQLNDSGFGLCDDIKFSDFVAYVIRRQRGVASRHVNPHWQRYNRICRPCDMQYTFVGKMENFKGDFEVVKDMMGINRLEYESSPSKRMSSYHLLSKRNISCLTNKLYVERVWRHMQGTGHLDTDRLLTQVNLQHNHIYNDYIKIGSVLVIWLFTSNWQRRMSRMRQGILPLFGAPSTTSHLAHFSLFGKSSLIAVASWCWPHVELIYLLV